MNLLNLLVLTSGKSGNLPGGIIALIVIGVVVLILLVTRIRVVPQTQAYIIERLGKYHATWLTGIHFLCPFVDRIAVDVATNPYGGQSSGGRIGVVNLKEQVLDFDPQPVITKDNVTMQIDTVIYFQIVDPKLFVYGVSNPFRALDNLTTTTIRNIMGGMELDVALTSRNVINETMRVELDEATDPWGIKVKRVEIKNIMPPKDIREAMEKQMRAEREKRAAILKAEGEKESAIRQAEGEKESAILRAEAKRESAIKEAEGQAQAILKINEAQAEGLKMIKDVELDKATLTLKSYEALEKLGNGQATKIIVPSDIQGLAGLAMSIKEVVEEKKNEE